MLVSKIGDIIKKSKYKREFIMKELRVSANTLSNWSTGKSIPSLEKAFQLAELLEVKVDDLYERKKAPYSTE
ncbi:MULTISPECIES: helix-turn-helix transcriptional regulator [unclassified Bacillus (in: firmicutes)]|nr:MULTISPECIES: helix-turn-helix transcriptional regulator [unclassified Bacillus (in: firmicutes)]MBT2725133.1 helix-turn-helix transcriptional regulator [Bacillus sp. ISL-46]MBT2729449.1 helix-turn-helix transcriptional regulator [Bacillus sp. ISL-75]MBT2744400.1 helix-turn-helix transcriptional regulator [Bacillus sp. ISL-77]